ncbi:MAG: uroporphyrinogen decarboxylase family protein [Arenicellales bacterium]|nr:uroporphyrinogen decarboxylase family protein [Arenicellales bacterium]MDP6855735.1 uroporphyrinogen decarboxylase family protein [Arenicellales bacterium]MDP6949322.1 uroporphyrinogen decarboxylase family protein [Arenicellales bacterium]
MPMTPRERVLMALNHEEPDRVPIVLGVSNATGIKMQPYQGIKRIVGIEAPDEYLYQWPELGTAAIDEATMVRLRSDVRGVLDLEPAATRRRNRKRAPHNDCIDSWGSGQVEVTPGYWCPGVHPLSDATTVEELENYPGWPDMSDPSRVAHVAGDARRLAAQNEYAIMATPWLLFPFERAYAMQGMEAFLLNMAMYPDFARALLEKIAGYCKALMGRFLDELGDNVDIIKIGDDLGTQESLMTSPQMYRDTLKPIHADFIDFIKARTPAKIFFHSCGDVFPLIEDFIDIGVDILNPIQTSSGKMSDLAALKKRFGRNIVFCGGIDSHRILPYGSAEEVRQEVRRVIGILGPGGGTMIGAVHTVMNDVPPENVLAMVDAVEEFGHYPLRD